MKIEKIDLYKYFNIDKDDCCNGTLNIYCWDVSNEMEGDKRVRPGMLILPGGAYAFVSDREAEPIAINYLQHGFNCFVLNYSVSPCNYPTQLLEASMAMIYLRENADKFHLDINHICAIGFSAGGHLCGMLGTKFDCEEVKVLRNNQFIRPDAVILSYPVTLCNCNEDSHLGSFNYLTNNQLQIGRTLSLEKLITENSSPAFIWHTFEDGVVPVKGTLVVAEKYREKKVPCELHIFEKGQHGLSIATDETNICIPDVQCWMKLSINWLKNRGFKIYS